MRAGDPVTAPAPPERFADFSARLIAAAKTVGELDDAMRICTEELVRLGVAGMFAEMQHARRDYLRAQMRRKGRPGWKRLPKLSIEDQYLRALGRALKGI